MRRGDREHEPRSYGAGTRRVVRVRCRCVRRRSRPARCASSRPSRTRGDGASLGSAGPNARRVTIGPSEPRSVAALARHASGARPARTSKQNIGIARAELARLVEQRGPHRASLASADGHTATAAGALGPQYRGSRRSSQAHMIRFPYYMSAESSGSEVKVREDSA